MRILQINPDDTHALRDLVLTEGEPTGEHSFFLDSENLSFHLGAFEGSKLVSVASFYYEKHNYIDGENHYRLCGLATLPEHQKKGYAKALLRMAYPTIKRNSCKVIWCNARQSVVPFFEKMGFSVEGEPFEIDNYGVHRLLVKYL